MILMNRMAAYLAGSGEQQLNYLAGETAVLRLGAAAGSSSYMLSAPGNLSFPIPADLSSPRVVHRRDRSRGQLSRSRPAAPAASTSDLALTTRRNRHGSIG